MIAKGVIIMSMMISSIDSVVSRRTEHPRIALAVFARCEYQRRSRIGKRRQVSYLVVGRRDTDVIAISLTGHLARQRIVESVWELGALLGLPLLSERGACARYAVRMTSAVEDGGRQSDNV